MEPVLNPFLNLTPSELNVVPGVVNELPGAVGELPGIVTGLPTIVSATPPQQEPVTAAFFKNYSRISSDVEDAVIEVFIQAAREKAEAYCNTDFVTKIKTKSFPANVRPAVAPADILSVSGFYTTVEEVLSAYNYWIEYQKGSIISRDYPVDYDNIPTYTLRYVVTINPADVPASVKVAIAKIAADLYENRENSSASANQELSINFKSLLAPFRKINNV